MGLFRQGLSGLGPHGPAKHPYTRPCTRTANPIVHEGGSEQFWLMSKVLAVKPAVMACGRAYKRLTWYALSPPCVCCQTSAERVIAQSMHTRLVAPIGAITEVVVHS